MRKDLLESRDDMSKGRTRFTRKVKRDNFTIIDNTFLRRKDMTARSKGLLTYLLALPDDWLVHKREIYSNHKEGYYALDTAFKELKDLGYINHFSVRDDKGKIERWECEIFEDPSDNESFENNIINNLNYPDRNFPKLDNPEQDKPKVGDSILGNQELLSTYNTNNLLNKELNELNDEDDDINIRLEKILNHKVRNQLKKAGIQNLTSTKLKPLGRAMYKLMNVHNRKYEEAEKIIMLAIEIYELNNGQSVNYLITLLKDWEDKRLYSAEEIRKYISDYKNGPSEISSQDIEPVPMINWLKEL